MEYRIINGAISYGSKTILEEINFDIINNDKIAIVGRNGTGKTSLLNAIIDNSLLETGLGNQNLKIIKVGNPKIGYLKQQVFTNLEETLENEILKYYQNIIKLEKKIKVLEEKLKNNATEEEIEEYTDSLEKYKLIGGYNYKKEYEKALLKFGFKESDKSKILSEFSGGERTKIAFLKLILSKPDILILDEPTNHLDIDAIVWLENYLKSYQKAVVVVSHDRMFLDSFVTKVYEIEYANLVKYTGNYTNYEIIKRQNYEKNLKDYEYQQKEIKRLKDIADRFKYKPSKASMAMSKLKKIEQMTLVNKPASYDAKTFNIDLKIDTNCSNNVLSVRDLEFGYDNPLGKVSFELYKGERLAIIGKNGTGKSSLIKTLIGDLKKISGTFSYGYNVNFAYFNQQIEFTNENNTIFEEYLSEYSDESEEFIRKVLGAFQFTGDDIYKQIKDLSGGEKVRLGLCKILKKNPNLLILDEPTNHLDIITKENLERVLKEYKGTILFVSHDRYFIKKLADSLLIFENNNISYFNGNYEEYLKTQSFLEDNEVISTKSFKKEKIVKERNNKKDIKKLENEISKIELEIKNIENEMLKEEVYLDYLKIQEVQSSLDNLHNDLEKKMADWEKLIKQNNDLL